MTTTDGDGPEVGAIVRDRLWGGTHTGTVVRREGRSVFVAWHHHSFVEDELDVDQVEFWPDAPEQLDHRCGGIGMPTGPARPVGFASSIDPFTSRARTA